LTKRGRGLGHVTYFSNFETPNISGTAEVTNLKFACGLKVRDTKFKKCKIGQKGVWLGHVIYIPNFGTPDISGTAEDTNLKFACRLTVRDTKPKNK